MREKFLLGEEEKVRGKTQEQEELKEAVWREEKEREKSEEWESITAGANFDVLTVSNCCRETCRRWWHCDGEAHWVFLRGTTVRGPPHLASNWPTLLDHLHQWPVCSDAPGRGLREDLFSRSKSKKKNRQIKGKGRERSVRWEFEGESRKGGELVRKMDQQYFIKADFWKVLFMTFMSSKPTKMHRGHFQHFADVRYFMHYVTAISKYVYLLCNENMHNPDVWWKISTTLQQSWNPHSPQFKRSPDNLLNPVRCCPLMAHSLEH